MLLVPPTFLVLITRTIFGLAYKSRMITEKFRQHLHRMQPASPVKISHKRAVKYVNKSERHILRQLLRRVCRACSMNSWRFPFSSRMGMEQLPSPIKDPTPTFVSNVTAFVNISFSCSFHCLLAAYILLSASPADFFLFLSLRFLSYCFV